MVKIVTIIGARPQFIKAAAVSRQIAIDNAKGLNVEEVIVHTGQHYDKNMSDVFFNQMQIPVPGYRLDINNLSHGAMTGQMLEQIEEILIKEKPGFVLVYGDTNTTLAGALAAKKLHIKVAHVEAGLRSYNEKMPEEINRIITDRISDILFYPTSGALENLKSEGFDRFGKKLVYSGDVMYDAAMFFKEFAVKPGGKNKAIDTGEFLLATVHRPENTDNRGKLTEIIKALDSISHSTPVVMPLHPRTKQKLIDFGIDLNATGISVIDPVSYFEMLYLLDTCKLVATDSGGLQKEAYFFHKYCITLRNETEWVELVEKGYNKLTGADSAIIVETYNEFNSLIPVFEKNLYGDGCASTTIVDQLARR